MLLALDQRGNSVYDLVCALSSSIQKYHKIVHKTSSKLTVFREGGRAADQFRRHRSVRRGIVGGAEAVAASFVMRLVRVAPVAAVDVVSGRQDCIRRVRLDT